MLPTPSQFLASFHSVKCFFLLQRSQQREAEGGRLGGLQLRSPRASDPSQRSPPRRRHQTGPQALFISHLLEADLTKQ